MNQPPQKKPTSKRALEEADFEAIYQLLPEGSWPRPKITLIWRQCVPPEATLDHFLYFLNACASRGLDPLLGECYLRIQFDQRTQQANPIIIVGINGALKVADNTNQLDGISPVRFEENELGVVSATCEVYRKERSHPFSSTIYFREYAALKDGKPVFMWATKPRVMLGKCCLMSALRLAFAGPLGGCYVKEEFDQKEPAAPHFTVESTDEPTPATPILAPKPESPERLASDAQPTVKTMLLAMKERIMADLDIPKLRRKEILNAYFQGFLDTSALPKEPEAYLPAMTVLDTLALTVPGVADSLKSDAEGFGIAAKLVYDEWFRFNGPLGPLAYRVAKQFNLASMKDLMLYIKANGINPDMPADVEALLRLALVDRELAANVATIAKESGSSISLTLQGLEYRLGGRVENFELATIEAALEARSHEDEPIAN